MPFWLQSDDLGGRGGGLKSYDFPVFLLFFFFFFFIRSSLTGLQPERPNRLIPLMAQTTRFDDEQTLFRYTITTFKV